MCSSDLERVERASVAEQATEGARAGAPVGSVVWHRLVLRGFGPFRDEVTLEFPCGLAHFVAPNEFGKSTLVEGLAAVLFGLPGSNDPAAFGQTRFRHWRGADRFEGEAEFTAADGQRYRVWRDFDAHRVRLERLGPTAEVLFDSTHNPRARRRSVSLEERLLQLIGIASRELFIQTFCVRQPLPEMPTLPDEVQALLSGAGGGTVQQSLDALQERLRAITKRKGELGVAPSNDRADRELERVEQAIAETEKAIQGSARLADELQQVRQRLAELQQERAQVVRELERAEAAERAWQEWLRLADRYDTEARRRSDLKRHLDEATELARRLREAEARLREAWPEMQGQSDETGALLQRLARIESESAELRQERERQVRGLRQAWGRAALAVWERWRTLRAWLEETGRRLETYAPLAAADEATRALLRDYERERARLERQLQEAQAQLDRALERRKQWETQERELYQAFAEVAAMEPQVAAAIDEKLDLLEECEALRQAQAEATAAAARRARQQRAQWASLVLATAAAMAAFFVTRAVEVGEATLAIASLVSAAAAAVLLVQIIRIFREALVETGPGGKVRSQGSSTGRLDELRQRQAELEAQLARIDRTLGDLAGQSAARLAELRAHWRQWQAQREQLERRRAEVPSEEALAGLQAQVRAAQAEWLAFQQTVRPYVARYPDPARAVAEWESLERQRAQLQEALASLAREQWGVEPGHVEALSPVELPGPSATTGGGSALPWAELGRMAGVRTLAELGEWLGRFDSVLWERPDQERDRWAKAPSEPEARLDWLDAMGSQAAGAAVTLQSQVDRTERRLAELEAEATDLRQSLAPILAACGGDAGRALARWQERAQHLQEMDKLRRALQSLLDARQVQTPEELADQVDQAQDGAIAARQQLDELVRRHPALPSVEMVSDREGASRRFEEIQAQAETLRQRRRQLDEELDALREQEVRLAGQQPVNVAEAEVELAELRARRDALWFEARALALAYRELEETVREYQASYRERLERGATAYFQAITGRPGRRVELDEKFAVSVVEPDGTRAVPAQLSKGAQDQLYLSLRLAIADLMASDLRLPFIFDDPFLNCDDERLGRIRQTLDAIAAGGRQVLLFSHRPDFAAWGEPATCTGASLARRESA